MTIPIKRRPLLMRAGLAALGLVLLQACSQVNELDDLRQYVRETQARPSGRIDPLPDFAPYESFLYRATSLRGPFQEMVLIEQTEEEEFVRNNLKPDFERPKGPLEAFKLENIRMVGTIHMLEAGPLTALVRDGDGEIHRVNSGNYIGRNFGEITQINETQLDIVEIVPDGRDGWMKRPRNLVLVENQ